MVFRIQGEEDDETPPAVEQAYVYLVPLQQIAASEEMAWGNVLRISPCDPENGDAAMVYMYGYNAEGPFDPNENWGVTELTGDFWQAGWPTKFYDDGTYE